MLQMQTANKKAKFKSGLVGILAVAGAFFTTACPPQPDKFSVSPLENPFSVDEGLPLKAGFKVKGSSIDNVVSTAHSPDYHQFEFSTVQPDKIFVTGQPIDPNNYGLSELRLELTSLDGKKAEYTLPINVIDTPDLVFENLPTSIEAYKNQTVEIIFSVIDDYSDWDNGITKSFVSDKYNVSFEAINKTLAKIILTPKSPTDIGPAYVDITVSDDEGNTKTKRVDITINDIVNPNTPPQISGPQEIEINEGLQHVIDFSVIDDSTSLQDLILQAVSEHYNVVGQKIAPSTYKVTITPIDPNFNGVTNLIVSAKDLEGLITTFNLPITVNDTPDLVFENLPTSIEAYKNQTVEIIFSLIDDYSDWYNGITKSFVSDKYNVSFEVINETLAKIILTPKSPTDIGPAYVDITVSDDEGNTKTKRVDITINDVPNQKPQIIIPEFTIKEGETKNHTISIIDEEPLHLLDFSVFSDMYFISTQKINDTDLLLTFTPKDEDYYGPFSVTFQATDTQNLAEKVTRVFEATPMTDLELNVLGQYLIVDNVVIGHNTVPLANAGVRVYKREINWVYEGYVLNEMGVDSNLGELLYAGTTDSQGNIKFKVDPQKEDENLLYVVLSKEGFLDKTRHLFGDEDLEAKTLILSQDHPLINQWLYYSLCNNGYQAMDRGVYIPKGNVTWRHLIFPNFPQPGVVVVKGDDEYVAPNVLAAIPEAVEYVLGPGYNISYSNELGKPQENTIYIEFWDYPTGQVWADELPVSNLINCGGIYIGREYAQQDSIYSSLVHELGHLLFINAHKEDMDSQYRQNKYFSGYPYFSELDKAVQQLVLAIGNMLPGDKYIFEGNSLKQRSFSVTKGEKIYYLQYE